ncbi:MFS transporter [Pseudorhodoferax sp.]|uniref:MFS transporter n=1 Tax=Pseudorhodoferax sp. TaxID=1993553 RepID=UPI002DD6A2C8|nr:MFS transporter [Pseudorhodoferax sp.]
MPAAGIDPARAARAAAVVIAAGVAAALHVGKLPPAIPALQAALGLGLVQAGFLLSLVQLAGMAAGVAFGVLADGLGLRRSVLMGLGVLALASLLGGLATGAAELLVLRAAEGFGFLLVVLAAPGLLRQLVPAGRLARVMGVWGAYMPLAVALALLLGPLVIEALGWRSWWWLLAALSVVMALLVQRLVPAPAAAPRAATTLPWTQRLRHTLAAPGPWLLALTFACYSGQWLAVVGFLPTIYREAGVEATLTGVLTALAAGVNIIGNVGSGRLLHRGVAPQRLLVAGFVTMALASLLAFAPLVPPGVPPALKYGAVLVFSAVGGMIPGTLFALVLRVAPGEHTLSSTVGWMQQWSALGQFAGPPVVAWLASRLGGWQHTWLATGASALVGLWLSMRIARLLRSR